MVSRRQEVFQICFANSTALSGWEEPSEVAIRAMAKSCRRAIAIAKSAAANIGFRTFMRIGTNGDFH